MSRYWQELVQLNEINQSRKRQCEEDEKRRAAAEKSAPVQSLNAEYDEDIVREAVKRNCDEESRISKKPRLKAHRKYLRNDDVCPLPEFIKDMQLFTGEISKVRNIDDRKVVYSQLQKKSLMKYARLMKEVRKEGDVYGVLSPREKKVLYNNKKCIDNFICDTTTSTERRNMLIKKPQIGDFFNTLAGTVEIEKVDDDAGKDDGEDGDIDNWME